MTQGTECSRSTLASGCSLCSKAVVQVVRATLAGLLHNLKAPAIGVDCTTPQSVKKPGSRKPVSSPRAVYLMSVRRDSVTRTVSTTVQLASVE